MPSEIVIHQPDPPSLVAELAPVVLAALAFRVDSVASHAEALERAKRLRSGEKAITEHFEPTRKHLEAARKANLAARDSLVAPIEAARLVYDRAAGGWEAEQRRIAAAESARLSLIARAAEEERQIEAAIQAEAEGQGAEAEAILAEPVMAPVVTVAPALAEVEGVSGTMRWRAELTDPAAFIVWLAAHPEETAMLARAAEACGPVVNTLATRQRGAMSIPGWRAVEAFGRSYR